MYLTYRDTKVEDLAQAMPFFHTRLAHVKGHEAGLQALLSHLVATKMAPTVVVEDQDRPAGQRVVGMSLGFFANDAFHTFLHDKKRSPFLAKHAIDWWADGKRPDITEDVYPDQQVGAGGHFVFLVKGVDLPNFKGPDLNLLREHASIAFMKCLFTHRIKTFVDEIYGAEELSRLKSFGMELYNDFGASGDPATQPYFVGVDTEKLRHDPSQTPSIAKRYALLPQPRFGFTLREQEILRLAMIGMTDREIAADLGLSLIGVKKRWEAMYARVPDLEREAPAGAKDAEDQPKQKRRTLVQLLADHPEELWRNRK